tara:strand:+ start:277 stop:570 length:294 start_codon:yes stop_codon:yes gene_type:complete
MFDFLFGKNADVETIASLSEKVKSLTEEINVLREDHQKTKDSLLEVQMSLTLLVNATQGVADDLAVLYTSIFGSEQSSKNSVMTFPLTTSDDEEYEN